MSAPIEKQLLEQRQYVADGKVPGFAQILFRQGRVVHKACHGYADRENSIPFTENTMVRLFSMTKPITTVALLILIEQGKIGWDDSVTRYLPAFRQMAIVPHANRIDAPPGAEKVRVGPTIRQLVMHTSGLSYGGYFGSTDKYACEKAYSGITKRVDTGDVATLAQFCDELAALPLRFRPATQWEYSHGIDVIGRVIEVVSGKSLDQFLKQNLFEPLGMQDTMFSVPPSKTKRLSALYEQSDSGLRRLDGGKSSAWAHGSHCKVLAGGGFMGSTFKTSDATSSVGGLVSTLKDYSRFLRMITCNGLDVVAGKRILKESTVKSILTNWLPMKSVAGGQSRIRGWHTAGRGWMGWCPLGQVSKDTSKVPDLWMGGIAGTFWAIDGERDLLVLHVTQVAEAYDFYGEELWKAGKETFQAVKRSAEPAQEPAAKKRRQSKTV